MEKMYFGCGIESQEKSELWHGDIWQRSPLYGDATIVINNGKKFSIIYCIVAYIILNCIIYYINIFRIVILVEYALGQFVQFIYNDRGSRIGQIEAIILSEHPNSQIQHSKALKMSNLLKHDELGIHQSRD